MTSRMRADSVSARDAALEGWGTPVGGLYTVTSLGSTARFRMIDDDPAHGILRAVRVDDADGDDRDGPTTGIDVPVTDAGSGTGPDLGPDDVGDGPDAPAPRTRRLPPAGIGRFGFDMLCRAASIENGNAFYGTYDPKVAARIDAAVGARKPTRAEEAAIFGDHGPDLDMATQYDDEAHHAARILDGLNMVPDDVVAAALLGRSGERLCPDPARAEAAEAEGLAALARIAARLLLDAPDADAATRRYGVLVQRVRELVVDALRAPEGRIATVRVATDAREDAALARYADERRGHGWKEDLRDWRRSSYETRWYAPLHEPDAAVLRDLMERIAEDEVKWLVAAPLPLAADEQVGMIVLRGGTALLDGRGGRGLEPIPVPHREGADGTATVEAFATAAFKTAPERWSTRLVARLVTAEGRRCRLYVTRVTAWGGPPPPPFVPVATRTDGADVFDLPRLAAEGVAVHPILATASRSERTRHELYEAVRAGGDHDAATQAGMDACGTELAARLRAVGVGDGAVDVPASTADAQGGAEG